MHAWTDGYEISEVNKSKTKKKNRKNRLSTRYQRTKRVRAFGAQTQAGGNHRKEPEKEQKNKRIKRIPAQGLEPWTTSFRYAKPENAIGSANSPLRSDLFFRTRYSSGNLIY